MLSSQTSCFLCFPLTVQVCRDTGRGFIVLLGCWAFGAMPFPVGWSPAGKSGRNQSNPMSLLYLSTHCANEQSEHTHTLYSSAPSIPLCPSATLSSSVSLILSQYTCLFSNHLLSFFPLQAKLKHHCMRRKQTSVWLQCSAPEVDRRPCDLRPSAGVLYMSF